MILHTRFLTNKLLLRAGTKPDDTDLPFME